MLHHRRSIKLPESGWHLLKSIAARLGCLYRGKPSWRVLVRRIASGELRVTPKE